MKYLDVGIPTYMRKEKLRRAVVSVDEARSRCSPVVVHLHVYFSSDVEMNEFKEDFGDREWIRPHLLHGDFRSSDFWNAHLEDMDADALCYLTDDIILDPDCLIKGWQALEDFNFDGVIGFNITNAKDGQPCKAAYGIVGKKFANRFPNRHVFCPEYACFYLDEELEKFSTSISRFRFCESAKLRHYHPDFTGDKPDQTHTHHRRNKFHDVMVHNMRVKRGYLWGKDFEIYDKEDG